MPKQLILTIFSMLLGLALPADGIRIQDGVYTGGPFVVLQLTGGQQRRIRSRYKDEMTVVLTAGQRAKISSETRLPKVPTRIYVAYPDYWDGMCTCFSSNIGVLLRKGYVQLPVSHLRSDREAKLREFVPDK